MSTGLEFPSAPPIEIVDAALKVSIWARKFYVSDVWMIGGLCSREYAEAIRPALSASDIERLQRIVEHIEAEAKTWADGFAVTTSAGQAWEPENEWAHIRWLGLKKDAEFLRQLAARHLKRMSRAVVDSTATHPDEKK